jgi:hypothetical protein
MKMRWIALFSLGLLASAVPARAQYYAQTNLVADEAGKATFVDPHLVNPWGLVSSATSPWWSANNGTLTSTLYDGNGVARPLVVTVPGPPTGIVFNGGPGFVVRNGAAAGPARFIFATEDGKIAGWNPAVRPTDAVVAADRSAAGAVYKGLAIDSATAGTRLYATDFHNGVVDVFDSAFNYVGSFTDDRLPQRYAPFGIQNVNGTLYVTFAKQDKAMHDDLAGKHRGFVDAFDTSGHLLRRVASRVRSAERSQGWRDAGGGSTARDRLLEIEHRWPLGAPIRQRHRVGLEGHPLLHGGSRRGEPRPVRKAHAGGRAGELPGEGQGRRRQQRRRRLTNGGWRAVPDILRVATTSAQDVRAPVSPLYCWTRPRPFG